MKIGLFADPHYATLEKSCGRRRPTLSYGKIEEAMQAFEGTDLVVCLGDLVDDCGTREENVIELKRVCELIRSFGIPFVLVLGNHDYYNFTREEMEELCDYPVSPLSQRYGDKLLIFLDANYREDGRVYAPHDVEWTNAAIPTQQKEWLARTMAESDAREIYVFIHENLDDGVEARHIIRNASEIRAMLAADGRVRGVYQGHYHRGHSAVIDGIPYETLSAMCEGEENSYRIIEI